ncbi:MAG TPA: YbgC/FadM family acyl-CoA thioesterase [Sphingomicrobium sp.]|nr:YbgC/FadM family acyl-CoA thioesterase [Sphingomicrobium sp.]
MTRRVRDGYSRRVSGNLDTPYRGGFVNGNHRFALTVYFEDTDAYGIVYYANYLRFMERARSDMIRSLGVDQAAELQRSGSAYAVVEVNIKYRSPARLGEDLQIISRVEQVRASAVHIQQRVMRGSELLTDAKVTAAFLDGDGRPRRQPREWVEKFRAVMIAQ